MLTGDHQNTTPSLVFCVILMSLVNPLIHAVDLRRWERDNIEPKMDNYLDKLK